MHSHHTIPRSRGGENSRQIILCANCHNVLHANALHVLALIRNPKLKRRKFWKNTEEEGNAKPWLEILVTALATPVTGDRKHLVSCELTTEEFLLFKQLALEYGSQEKTLLTCIRNTLKAKGLLQNEKQSDVWYLRFPQQRKNI